MSRFGLPDDIPPLGGVQIEVSPFRGAKLTRAYEWRKPQGALHGKRAAVAVERAQQFPDMLWFSDGREVLPLCWRQRTP
jgi:hypothetical protein